MSKYLTVLSLLLFAACLMNFPQEVETISHFVSSQVWYRYLDYYYEPYYYTYCTNWWYYNYWYNWYYYRYYWWYPYYNYCYTRVSYNYYSVWRWTTYTVYSCATGWTGSNCDIPVCSPICTGNNVCQDVGDNPTCACYKAPGSTSCTLRTCTSEINCYPGTCESNVCKCVSGFSGTNCEKIEKRSTILDCGVKVFGQLSAGGPLQVVAESNVCSDIDKSRLETIWIKTKIIDKIEVSWSVQYEKQNLPTNDAAPYVSNAPTPVGISESKFNVIPESGQPTVGQCNFRTPYESLVKCDSISVTWSSIGIQQIANNLTFLIEVTAKVGGVKNGALFTPQVFTESPSNGTVKRAKFAFDVNPPYHCLNRNRSCEVFPITINESITAKPKIVPTFNEWKDDESGIEKYYAEIFYMSPDVNNLLKEIEPALSSRFINISVDNFQYTLPKPGTYSIVLTAFDRANNTNKARKIITYNNIPLIMTNVPLMINGAAIDSVTGLSFINAYEKPQSGLCSLKLNWTGVFKSSYQESWLAEVKTWQDQNKEGLDDNFGNKFGSRSTDSFTTYDSTGIDSISITYQFDSRGGKGAVRGNNSTVIPRDKLVDQTYDISVNCDNIQNGITFVAWLDVVDIGYNNFSLVTKTYFDTNRNTINITSVEFVKNYPDESSSEIVIHVVSKFGGVKSIAYQLYADGKTPILDKVQEVKVLGFSDPNAINKRDVEKRCDSNNDGCYCIPVGFCFSDTERIVINHCDIDKYLDLGLSFKYQVISLSSQNMTGELKLGVLPSSEIQCRKNVLSSGAVAGIVIGVLICVALLIGLIVLIFLYKKKPNHIVATRMRTMAATIQDKWVQNNMANNDLYVSEDEYVKSVQQPKLRTSLAGAYNNSSGCDVPIDKVSILETAATGRFAVIQKAKMSKGRDEIIVALKSLKNGYASRDDEIMRSKILFMASKVKPHPNVIEFYGSTTDHSGNPAMLMEYCDLPLKEWLSSISKPTLDEMENMLIFTINIASGMEHLHSLNIIHKRLAARNVMLKKNLSGLEAKLIGFGPSKDELDDKDKNILPIKWCALETLESINSRRPIFNTKTDAWSFGVTVWEIYSKGEAPYSDCRSKELEVLIKKGLRLERPDICPPEVFDIAMIHCWDAKANSRPEFKTLVKQLHNFKEGAQNEDHGYYASDKEADLATGYYAA